MPNPKYRKGVRKERAVVNEAKAKGYISFRSAGSHSPIDVIVINPIGRTIQLIQCKSGNYRAREKSNLLSKYRYLNDTYTVRFKVV